MTSPITHVIAAFICLIFINRLFKLKITEERLFILSCISILPDLMDKYLTGQRYVFHSVVFSSFFLLTLFLIIYYFTRNKYPQIPIYFALAAIAFLTHSIMDLSGWVVILWPLDPSHAYHIEWKLMMVQTIHIPPLFDTFIFEIQRIEVEFGLVRYGVLGELITPLDILISSMLALIIVLWCIKIMIKKSL